MRTPVRAIGITHPGSPRYARFIAMLEALGLPYEIRPAVFVQGDLPWSPHYDHAARMRNLGYPMRAGEVGCFLAHRGAWEAAAAFAGCSLVLEDDAFVDPARVPLILAAADHLAGGDCAARLISQPRTSFRTWRELGGGACLGRPTRAGNLAVGYLVSPGGAAALSRGSRAFWCPVDDYMNLEHTHGCLLMQFDPEIAEHRDEGASLIGGRAKPRVGLGIRLLREARRAWRNVRDRLHAWRTLARLGLCFRRVRRPSDPVAG